MPDWELLKHDKDADQWIVSSPDWDDLYTEKIDILDLFNIVQVERVFYNKWKTPSAWFKQRLADYCTPN